MSLKRVLLLAFVAFAIFYILRSPDAAAQAFRVGGETALQGAKSVAEALARFVDSLFLR